MAVGEGIAGRVLDPLIKYAWNNIIKATILVDETQRKDLSEIDPERISGEAVALCVRVKNVGPMAANKCRAELRLRGKNRSLTKNNNVDVFIESLEVNPVPWDDDGAQSEVTLNPSGASWLIVAYLTGSGFVYFPEGSTLSPVTPKYYYRSSHNDNESSKKPSMEPSFSKGIPMSCLLNMDWSIHELSISGQTKAEGFRATESVLTSFKLDKRENLDIVLKE